MDVLTMILLHCDLIINLSQTKSKYQSIVDWMKDSNGYGDYFLRTTISETVLNKNEYSIKINKTSKV